MFRRILVPVDLTEKNRAAIRIAKDYRDQNGSEVTLLHVIETLEHIPFEEMRPFYSRLENRAKKEMEKQASEFGQDAAKVNRAIVYGHRVEAIVDYAQQHRIDLIVMASHRGDAGRPASGWATISHKVGILSPSPVLLVK